MAKNPEYWQRLALGILTEEIQSSNDIPILSIDHSIADAFQKAVIFVMLEKETKAEFFFSRCLILIQRKNSFKTTIKDYQYLMLIHWLRKTAINGEYCRKLYELQLEKIISILCQYENKTVFKMMKDSIPGKIQENPNITKISFTRISSDKYLYEATADHCLEAARYSYLCGDYTGAAGFCECSQNLYDEALALIPKMLSRKKKIWKEMEKNPEIQQKIYFPDQYNEYIKEKENLKGNIPNSKSECSILRDLAFSRQGKIDKKLTLEKTLNFFEEVINPAGKIYTSLSLTDEIIWTIIAWILAPQSGHKAPDILRKYLG
ncbi:MAG: hypothetical protein LWY06_11480 [Firmicutes bacterium]|nr:hypothetical protein [Bacillota bacterium]